MFPEDVAQKRRRLGHETFASHIAQVSALPGVQRSVTAARRRRHQLVVRFVVVVLQVLVRVVVVVVVAAARRLASAVAVAAAPEAAATASHAFPDHLAAAAHDRGVGAGRGEFLELRRAAHDATQQRRRRRFGYRELAVSPPEPMSGLRLGPQSGICKKKKKNPDRR